MKALTQGLPDERLYRIMKAMVVGSVRGVEYYEHVALPGDVPFLCLLFMACALLLSGRHGGRRVGRLGARGQCGTISGGPGIGVHGTIARWIGR